MRSSSDGEARKAAGAARRSPNRKAVDADALVTNPVDIAAAIRKNMPARKVTVRRRVMSEAASLSNGHYGHVGIGIKVARQDGHHYVTSVCPHCVSMPPPPSLHVCGGCARL